MSKRTHTAEIKQRFSQIYEEHADSIFRFAIYKLSDREKAKDVVQESFVKMWEYMSTGSDVQNPRALIFRIASNAIIDSYRRKKDLSLDFLTDEGYDPADHDQAGRIVDKSEGALALALVNKLDPQYRDVLLLRFVDGLPVQEIAEMLDERENTVSVRLHRGIKELKDLFEHNPTQTQ